MVIKYKYKGQNGTLCVSVFKGGEAIHSLKSRGYEIIKVIIAK